MGKLSSTNGAFSPTSGIAAALLSAIWVLTSAQPAHTLDLGGSLGGVDVGVGIGGGNGLDVDVGLGGEDGVNVDVGVGGGTGVGVDVNVGGATGVDLDVAIGAGADTAPGAAGAGAANIGAGAKAGMASKGGLAMTPTRKMLRQAQNARCSNKGNSDIYNGFIVFDKVGYPIGVVHAAWVGTDLKIQKLRFATSSNFISPARCLTIGAGNSQVGQSAIKIGWTGNDIHKLVAKQ